MSHRALGPQFHATVNEDWPPKDDWVHVGTEASARHRMKDFDEDYFEERLAGKPLDQARWKLHQVAVTGRVYPHVLTDEAAGDFEAYGPKALPDHGFTTPASGYHAFRYVNSAEDPGSESVMAHSSAVRVTKTQRTNEPLRWKR